MVALEACGKAAAKTVEVGEGDFKVITAGGEIWRRVRFQGFLNSLL